MAALQKIRSKGTLLVIVIGLALFGFIAGDFFKSFEASDNAKKQQIGEVNGKTLSAHDYQTLIDEYTETMKFLRGASSFSDDETNQIKDQVWQTYVNYELVRHEADKLGLTVTDAEMEEIIHQGINPMLAQTPFKNEKTGQFDVNLLRKFLTDYADIQTKPDQVPAQYVEYYQKLYKYWTFTEKTIRQNLLLEKYQVLLSKALISNPVSAKLAFEGRTQSSNLLVAAVPYTTLSDKDVEVTAADLKAKYKEKKEQFRQYVESRDIKYIDIAVIPSGSDSAGLNKEMEEYALLLQSGNPEDVVRTSNSLVAYSSVFLSKKAFPQDIQAGLDTISTGTQTAPFYTYADNSQNIIKLIGTTQSPDSIRYKAIQVNGATPEAARKSADSIYTALKSGVPFDTLAVKYGQPAQAQWLTSASYEGGALDENSVKYLKTLSEQPVNGIANIELPQGNVIVQVLVRRNIITKYNVAVIKRTIDFSKETYAKAYNAFSRFLAANPTLKEIEENASKNGYRLNERTDFYSAEHSIGNIPNTVNALRWAYEASAGDVSPLYECGNNDRLLIVAVTKIHKAGYRPVEEVKDALTQLVLKDRKAEKLLDQLKGVKTLAAAGRQKGVVVDTLRNVSFAVPVFVQATGSTEPVLSGSVWHKKAGQFAGPLKGEQAVYFYQVISTAKTKDKYDEKAEEATLQQRNMQAAGSLISDLYIKANVKDKRYLYF